MAEPQILATLQALSNALVMVDARSDRAELEEVVAAAAKLDESLRAAGSRGDALGVTGSLLDILKRLVDGQFSSPGAAFGVANQLAQVLQGLENPAGIDEAARKQALAQAGLLAKDVDMAASQDEGSLEDDDQREMVIEVEKRLDELEQTLFGIEGGERRPDTVRGVFREFHTLKGESAIIGLQSVADFWHSVESSIEPARRGELVLTEGLLESLRDSVDLGRRLLQGEGREDIGEERFETFAELLHAAAGEAKQAAANAEEPPPPTETFDDFFDGVDLPPPPAPETPDAPPADADAGESVPAAAANAAGEPSAAPEPDEAAPPAPPMPAPSETVVMEPPPALAGAAPAGGPPVDNAGRKTIKFIPPCRAGSKLVDDPFGTATPPPRAATETVSLTDTAALDTASLDTAALESVDASELSAVAVPAGLKRRTAARSPAASEERRAESSTLKAIPIDVQRLDQLLEFANQVALSSTHLEEHSLVIAHPDLSDRVKSLVRAGRMLYGLAAGLRMTAIKPLFMTLRRAAMDAARASRKLIAVTLEGVDTQVDRAVVEGLSAALVHVVRNAVDHGIEAAETRREAGKPERGQIRAAARRSGADVIIEFSDDGQGFDLERIHAKAVGMGLVPADRQLTDAETAELVFLPGLSTARKVTGLSGRGVGMEIVKTSIDALNGRVEIDTRKGRGTTLRLRLPVALAALEGLLLRVGRSVLVFPVFSVRECFRVKAEQVSTVQGGGTVVSIRGVVVPVLFLDREFGVTSDAKRVEDGVLALVEEGDSLCAVLIDEALEARQVLIRPADPSLGKIDMVSGMALLPDQSVAMVVDVRKFIEKVGVASAQAFSEAGRQQAQSERKVDTVSIGSNQVGMIDFTVRAPGAGPDGARASIFAINAFKTREFVPVKDIQPLPGAPRGFVGVQILRGEAVPIVHLGVMCGLLEPEERRPEWDSIVLLCEFAGRTVGFMVSQVNRVSYISWGDIMPPPESGGLFKMDYVVGTILMSRLGHTQGQSLLGRGEGGEGGGQAARRQAVSGKDADNAPPDVAFVLDFERIVGNVIRLYGDMGAKLTDYAKERKNSVTIMLVEDSPLIRKQTVKALEKAGLIVIQAGDGQEAWDKLEGILAEVQEAGGSVFSKLDLVMSDIEMPRMDGYTLTTRIKQHPELRVLPVLLHSSITNDMMIRRAQEVQADGFVPKCDPKELADQLNKYL